MPKELRTKAETLLATKDTDKETDTFAAEFFEGHNKITEGPLLDGTRATEPWQYYKQQYLVRKQRNIKDADDYLSSFL